MEEVKGEQIRIVIEYFKESHKDERIGGTIVLIVMMVVPIILFPLNVVLFGYIVFCFLIYLKFLYDIKQKCDRSISKFLESEK